MARETLCERGEGRRAAGGGRPGIARYGTLHACAGVARKRKRQNMDKHVICYQRQEVGTGKECPV